MEAALYGVNHMRLDVFSLTVLFLLIGTSVVSKSAEKETFVNYRSIDHRTLVFLLSVKENIDHLLIVILLNKGEWGRRNVYW
jgi:hypothetical protein